jgi:adenylate kinase family enzyme
MTYDRASIQKWLDEGIDVCTTTKKVLQRKELIPNHTLRRLIHDQCVSNCYNGIIRILTPKLIAEVRKVHELIWDIQDVTDVSLHDFSSL